MGRTALALALRVPSEERRRADDKARVPRTRVRARDRAHSARGQDALLPNPFARSEPSPQARARIRGRVLFGYFLLHEQEKVTRPPGWRTEKRRDASRFSRSAEDQEQMDSGLRRNDERKLDSGLRRNDERKLDSGLRRNDERRWIPAFA